MSFDHKGMKAEKMEINLESILPSLAKNLYGDDWRIAIRELLQNCHDALAEAEAKGLITDGVGMIKIVPDPGAGTLTFEDNGIGMTAAQVKEHLATVGAGSKRQQLEAMSREGEGDRRLLDQLIGQYGIGFLSSFIIADRVEVSTRSLEHQGEVGVRALFTGETQWYSQEDPSAAYGTRITLKLKQAKISDPMRGTEETVRELLNFEQLKQEVRRFGDILPYPIHVHRNPDDRTGDQCNSVTAPWERDTCVENDLIDFVRGRQPEENEPLSPEPFVFTRGTHDVDAHGILYFPRPASHLRQAPQSVAKVELFCRRMFISQQIEALLPAWASFVGAVVECPDLTPILNRNDVIRHNPEFVALKGALGRAITGRIEEIAERHPQRFKELRNEHGERLYSALLANFRDEKVGQESFFRHVVERLPFTVIDRSHPSGTAMTLTKYRDEARKRTLRSDDDTLERIFFLPNSASIGQYRAMVLQKDLPVIEALHPAEPALLDAYGKAKSSEVSVEPVTSVLDLYVDEVPQEPYEPLKQFLASLDGGGPDDVRASRFAPSYVPAITLVQAHADEAQAAMIERFVQDAGGVLKGKIRETLRQEVLDARHGKAKVTVLLNDSNPVIRAIRDHCTAGKNLAGAIADTLHEIYHVARAYTDPRVAESEHYFEHRNKILDAVVRLDQALNVAQEEQTGLKLRLKTIEEDRAALRHQVESLRDEDPADVEFCRRRCALLVTDLRGSSRMVGFLGRTDSAEILRDYAGRVQRIVEDHGGRVEKFTGDGIFAYFEASDGRELAIQGAYDAAAQIQVTTSAFFNRAEVNNTLQASGGIRVDGCRTVLHYGDVMLGSIAGSRTLVGPQVVAAFRAVAHKDLFKECSTVLSGPFFNSLQGVQNVRSVATAVKLDDSLPAMDFFPHPGLSKPATVS
ncbi:MAG: ATP-binding protein [Acidobacteriota bacterium]